MNERSQDGVQLLHSLGYMYGEFGHTQRAIVLLLLASHLDPDNPQILRTLANVYLRDNAADNALGVIEQLEKIDTDLTTLTLLKSKALWLRGEAEQARHIFRDFVDLRDHKVPA
ncbi:tetratricopeptide repeat protein [Agaricicola taiwanensis]|uniref:tetratricopeptide repeat protein n=1 Tax=Agaricicola taiwanensis TaxID=591372 RepID=UPI001664534C|nr:type III secretion protein [Agaricicola taiwanensis]